MPANLLISFPHGSALQIVRAFQDSIFSIFLFYPQHSFLQALFLFLFFRIREQVKRKRQIARLSLN